MFPGKIAERDSSTNHFNKKKTWINSCNILQRLPREVLLPFPEEILQESLNNFHMEYQRNTRYINQMKFCNEFLKKSPKNISNESIDRFPEESSNNEHSEMSGKIPDKTPEWFSLRVCS